MANMVDRTLQIEEENKRLQEENRRLREAVEELATLNAITLDIATPDKVDELNRRIVARVVKHTRASQGAVFLLGRDRKSTRLNSSHIQKSRMPSSA